MPSSINRSSLRGRPLFCSGETTSAISSHASSGSSRRFSMRPSSPSWRQFYSLRFFVRSLGFGLDLSFSVSNIAVMRQRYRVAASDSRLDQSCLQQSMPFKGTVNGLLNFVDLFLRLGL